MKLFLTILLSVSLFTQSVLAESMGNEGGHGGDSYALEFVSLGKTILEHLKNEKHQELLEKNKVDLVLFNEAIKDTLVYSDVGSEVTLRGQEVDAINFPERGRILLNRTRWTQARLEQKLKLVLHEYFGIINIERDTYEVSLQFSDILSRLAEKLLKQKEPPQHYYGVCELSLPLYATNTSCDTRDELVQQILRCAQDKALLKCQASASKKCSLIDVQIKRKTSTEAFGLVSCEATAVTR